MNSHAYMSTLALVIALALSSCKSMGPRTIPPDGFNYNERIALQDNEQLLLNIVRLRYAEVPTFLNVASVINQYTRTGNAGISGATGPLGETGAGNLGGSWSDRPTITYTPMTGQSFSQSLLTPLTPSVILFLIQSGWAVDRLMRLTSTSINRLHSEKAGPRNRKQADPEFNRLLEIMGQLQSRELLGLHFSGDWPTIDVQVHFPQTPPEESDRVIIQEFKELLNLNPDTNKFSIGYGLIRDNDSQIVVQTRSMLEMMVFVGWHVEAPQEHIDEGRTFSTFEPEGPALVRIFSSEKKPKDAFLSIEFKNHWYYIDDREVASKTTFGVMRILLSLANDSDGSVGPLISIGN